MKTKIINGLSNIDYTLLQQIRSNYTFGIDKHIITVKNADGTDGKAILVATSEFSYLIKLTKHELREVMGTNFIYETSYQELADSFIDNEFESNL